MRFHCAVYLVVLVVVGIPALLLMVLSALVEAIGFKRASDGIQWAANRGFEFVESMEPERWRR